jgi:hypothetical protein
MRGSPIRMMEASGIKHIAPDAGLLFLSDLFENFEKQATPTGGGEKGLTLALCARKRHPPVTVHPALMGQEDAIRDMFNCNMG